MVLGRRTNWVIVGQGRSSLPVSGRQPDIDRNTVSKDR